MGEHEGKPRPTPQPYEIPTPDKHQSDGRPDDGKHEKPSTK